MEEPDNVEFENLLAAIRSLAAAEALRVTPHAQQEMVEKGNTLDEVLQAIRNGEILEAYPEHRRGACCRVDGFTDEDRPLDIICTTGQPLLILIAAYPTPAAEMVNAPGEEKPAMKCTIAGCPGVYAPGTVVHTVQHQGEVVVFEHVPAEVCNVCGDVLLAPETVRRIETLLKTTPPPRRNIAYFEFA
jgi:YgiT-type zinc finger domain-containing protein